MLFYTLYRNLIISHKYVVVYRLFYGDGNLFVIYTDIVYLVEHLKSGVNE